MMALITHVSPDSYSVFNLMIGTIKEYLWIDLNSSWKCFSLSFFFSLSLFNIKKKNQRAYLQVWSLERETHWSVKVRAKCFNTKRKLRLGTEIWSIKLNDLQTVIIPQSSISCWAFSFGVILSQKAVKNDIVLEHRC